MLPLLLVIALVLAGATVSCVANDTSASIDAGGLVFTKNTSIQIKSEVLYISPERIEVDYVFPNPTAVDVTTVVAFPLPVLDLDIDSAISIPFKGQQNFVGFKTWVDEKEIQMDSDIHAILRDGRDVTKELQGFGVNIFAERQVYAPEVQSQLLKLGALAEEKGNRFIWQLWKAKVSFHWTQTFPAGKEIHIRHTYSAGPFKSFVTEQEAEWCTGDAYKAAFRKLPKTDRNSEFGYFPGEAVRYVLKTGANGAGPIGDFAFKLDKAGRFSFRPVPYRA